MTWPTGFGSPLNGHLGSRVDALVDGQLAHGERERALAHVAHCPSCRRELMAAREVKATLGRLGEPPVPGDLTSRLLAVAGPDDLGGPLPGPPPALASSRRVPAGAVGALGLAVGAVLLVGLPSAGSGGGPSPRATPAVRGTGARAGTTARTPVRAQSAAVVRTSSGVSTAARPEQRRAAEPPLLGVESARHEPVLAQLTAVRAAAAPTGTRAQR
ncbi:putative zinc finger protein [Motilibacter rhizosphaerae]|uniref:Putative zinc finger protein n=1 Tax=Motilibacter rhizosphaerae TaxID=598652 RepID=A0A4Q7NPK6_9ACTN|nr:zf-HC2 domain-containing protein [Motilibacter rhizosphaerae]RZS87245.1 putative zinc finger protein [Motilibacter rhizosphaerae]